METILFGLFGLMAVAVGSVIIANGREILSGIWDVILGVDCYDPN
jgi:hypothetical protein